MGGGHGRSAPGAPGHRRGAAAGCALLGFDRRWPLLAGLLLGAAAAARLPVGLALPLLLYLYRRGGWAWVLRGHRHPGRHRGWLQPGPLRDPFEFGYGLIRDVDGNSVLDESWYPHGIDSIWYIPQGLYTMLLKGVDWQDECPGCCPAGAARPCCSRCPSCGGSFEARGRLALVAGITAALVMLPDLAHGNPGFAQVGYRFIVDALPLLWVLLAIAFRDGLTRAASVALAVGSAVTIWLCSVVWLGYQDCTPPGLRAPGRRPATTGTGPPGRATARRRPTGSRAGRRDHMIAWPLCSDQQVELADRPRRPRW